MVGVHNPEICRPPFSGWFLVPSSTCSKVAARNYHAHAPRHGFVPRQINHTPIALTKCWSVATIDEEAFFSIAKSSQVLQVQLVALFPPRNCHQNSVQIAGSGAVRPKDRGLIFKDSDALPAPTHPSDCFEIWSHKFEWEGSL